MTSTKHKIIRLAVLGATIGLPAWLLTKGRVEQAVAPLLAMIGLWVLRSIDTRSGDFDAERWLSNLMLLATFGAVIYAISVR